MSSAIGSYCGIISDHISEVEKATCDGCGKSFFESLPDGNQRLAFAPCGYGRANKKIADELKEACIVCQECIWKEVSDDGSPQGHIHDKSGKCAFCYPKLFRDQRILTCRMANLIPLEVVKLNEIVASAKKTKEAVAHLPTPEEEMRRNNAAAREAAVAEMRANQARRVAAKGANGGPPSVGFGTDFGEEESEADDEEIVELASELGGQMGAEGGTEAAVDRLETVVGEAESAINALNQAAKAIATAAGTKKRGKATAEADGENGEDGGETVAQKRGRGTKDATQRNKQVLVRRGMQGMVTEMRNINMDPIPGKPIEFEKKPRQLTEVACEMCTNIVALIKDQRAAITEQRAQIKKMEEIVASLRAGE
jgi:hypothetical protein